MLKRMLFSLLVTPAFLLILSCSEDAVVEPVIPEGEITGRVQFISGEVGSFARVNLQYLADNRTTIDTADQDGIFVFENLNAGDYILSFESTDYYIYPFRVGINLPEKESVYQDLYIVYKVLDDEKARTVNDSIVLVKYHRGNAGIGDNYQVIDNLTGYFGGDLFNNATLSCEIYELPNDFDWTDYELDLTAEYVRENYTYVTEVKDTIMFGNHEIVFRDEEIPKILSNPSNGFAFVRKDEPGRILKIPCVDRFNNDFGLIINYKQ
jgi:hypothetical protein